MGRIIQQAIRSIIGLIFWWRSRQGRPHWVSSYRITFTQYEGSNLCKDLSNVWRRIVELKKFLVFIWWRRNHILGLILQSHRFIFLFSLERDCRPWQFLYNYIRCEIKNELMGEKDDVQQVWGFRRSNVLLRLPCTPIWAHLWLQWTTNHWQFHRLAIFFTHPNLTVCLNWDLKCCLLAAFNLGVPYVLNWWNDKFLDFDFFMSVEVHTQNSFPNSYSKCSLPCSCGSGFNFGYIRHKSFQNLKSTGVFYQLSLYTKIQAVILFKRDYFSPHICNLLNKMRPARNIVLLWKLVG